MDRVVVTRPRVTLGNLVWLITTLASVLGMWYRMEYRVIELERELQGLRLEGKARDSLIVAMQRRSAAATFSAEDGEEMKIDIVAEIKRQRLITNERLSAIEQRLATRWAPWR